MSESPLSPDRLFPPDPTTRAIARRLYDAVADAPILSPHGHVDAAILAEDAPFPDPAALLITPDHYVTRMLHANGVPLDRLGLGPDRAGADPRGIWRLLCEHWTAFAGTPVRYWLEDELATVFEVDPHLSAANADATFDELSERLASPGFRPRALFERFGIRVLATTDDPTATLEPHRTLRDDPAFSGHVLPTMRADRFFSPAAPGWAAALDELTEASGVDCATHAGLIDALRDRRRFFLENGATATDTGVADAWAEPLDAAEAERIHGAGIAGTVTAAESDAYRRHLLYRWAELSTEDGLVMQLHPGVVRGHHAPTVERFGADTGSDVPDTGAFTRPLRRLLNDFGTHPNLHLVLFTVDETVFSREVGPLAGFYPSVYAGAPWWFLDSPAGIRRYREAITDSAGFEKTSGFIDDTRAFCSIPARHDASRRLDAGYLAGLVATHQLDEDDATVIAGRLVREIPARTFRLERYL